MALQRSVRALALVRVCVSPCVYVSCVAPKQIISAALLCILSSSKAAGTLLQLGPIFMASEHIKDDRPLEFLLYFGTPVSF